MAFYKRAVTLLENILSALGGGTGTPLATEATQISNNTTLEQIQADLDYQFSQLTNNGLLVWNPYFFSNTGIAEYASLIKANTDLLSQLQQIGFGAPGGGLRTASQIGNAFGAADWSAGNTSAQTLRVAVASNSIVSIGPSGTAAAWGAGVTTTATLRTTLASDSAGLSDLAALNTKAVQLALNFGVLTGALRVSAIPGNASGIADFNSGITTAQTPRVTIASDQSTINVSPQATENHIGAVGGLINSVTAEFARPADTTNYAPNDVVSTGVGALITFSSFGRIPQGSGYITKARLTTDLSTDTKQYRLHLFHTAPSAIADNSPYTLLWTNRSKRIGIIDFDALTTEGAGSDCAHALNTAIRLAYNCDAANAAIYGILETLTAGTDSTTQKSAQNFSLELSTDSN